MVINCIYILPKMGPTWVRKLAASLKKSHYLCLFILPLRNSLGVGLPHGGVIPQRAEPLSDFDFVFDSHQQSEKIVPHFIAMSRITLS